MYAYRIFGHRLNSNVALRRLPNAGFGGGFLGEIRFEFVSRDWRDEPLPAPEVTQNFPDGAVFAQFARSGAHYVARYAGAACFQASVSPLSIRAECGRRTSPATVEHLLLDQIIPRLLPLSGAGAVLHSSCAALDGSAAAFIAPSRTGKSTLITHLARNGFELLSDDSILVSAGSSGFAAVPSYPAVRLWRDSADRLLPAAGERESVSQYNSKAVAGAESGIAHRAEPAPLCAIFEISNRVVDALSIEPLVSTRRFPALLEASLRMEVRDSHANLAEFQRLAGLVDAVPMFEIAYPRRYDILPEAAAAIAHTLCRHGATMGICADRSRPLPT